MGSSKRLFEGLTFFLQYSDRPKDTFFSDMRLIRKNDGRTTRFPLNSKPTHVVVDIPGQPRFHTYSLPAHSPPASESPVKWTLDQLLEHFTNPETGDDVVVVQRQWIIDCVRSGNILADSDEWGGWRVRSRRRRSSPDVPHQPSQDLSAREVTDSKDGPKLPKRPRLVRSASDTFPPSLLPLKEYRQRRSASFVPDDTLAERMSRSYSPTPPIALAQPMSSEQPVSLKTRIRRFKPIADAKPTPLSSVSSSARHSPPITESPGVSPIIPASDAAPTLDAPEPDSEASSLLETPDTSFGPSNNSRPTASLACLPLINTTEADAAAKHSDTAAERSVEDNEEGEPAFAIIKRFRLGSVTTMKHQAGKAAASWQVDLTSNTGPGLAPEKPSSAALAGQPESSFAVELPAEPRSEVIAVGPTVSGVHSDVLIDPSEPDNGGGTESGEAVAPNDLAQNQCTRGTLGSSDDDELSSLSAPRTDDYEIPADHIEGYDSRTSDVVRRLVADGVMDVEQQVEALLQANHSISSPVHSPPLIPDIPAPLRPNGVFGMFSFGLTHPLSFFVTEGTEPGIPRMISMAGGASVALEKARFIIVPGNAGDELTRELHGIASGDGIAPWARVVHEQWIKHCFRDQSVLSPDDYLARASSQPSEADSAAATSDDDEVSDVPPRDVLVRVNKIIKAVRDWKAGKIKTKTNYKTVYNFVDNLSSTQGIKGAATLYRTYRAYIARVAPDVAKAPK